MLLILFIYLFIYRHASSVTEETSQTLLSITHCSLFLSPPPFFLHIYCVHVQKTCFQARLLHCSRWYLMQGYTVPDGILVQCYTVLDAILNWCYTVLDAILIQRLMFGS